MVKIKDKPLLENTNEDNDSFRGYVTLDFTGISDITNIVLEKLSDQ